MSQITKNEQRSRLGTGSQPGGGWARLLEVTGKQWSLWLVGAAGFVIIGVFGFGMHQSFPGSDRVVLLATHSDGLPFTHAEWWEVGALLWTAVFLFYYFCTFPFTNTGAVDKLVAALLLLLLPSLVVVAYKLLSDRNHPDHLRAVLCIGLTLLAIDYVLSKFHMGNVGRTYEETLRIADIPIVVAFTVLAVYEVWHGHARNLEVFMAGAISFQLLASHVVFILSQSGLIRRIWAKDDAN